VYNYPFYLRARHLATGTAERFNWYTALLPQSRTSQALVSQQGGRKQEQGRERRSLLSFYTSSAPLERKARAL